MSGRGLGPLYLGEYLKILDHSLEAMQRFPLTEMTAEERKAVVLRFAELVEGFQGQLKDAGISKLLDLYQDELP